LAGRIEKEGVIVDLRTIEDRFETMIEDYEQKQMKPRKMQKWSKMRKGWKKLSMKAPSRTCSQRLWGDEHIASC